MSGVLKLVPGLLLLGCAGCARLPARESHVVYAWSTNSVVAHHGHPDQGRSPRQRPPSPRSPCPPPATSVSRGTRVDIVAPGLICSSLTARFIATPGGRGARRGLWLRSEELASPVIPPRAARDPALKAQWPHYWSGHHFGERTGRVATTFACNRMMLGSPQRGSKTFRRLACQRCRGPGHLHANTALIASAW